MELLAVFIKNHFLFKKPEFLNFGGLYLFDFELKENGLYISKSKNTQHIKNFYGENILNVSAIVGNNGSGKTSVMRVLSEDPSKDTVLVYLSKGKIVIKNDARLNLIAQFEYKECKQENKLHPLYFSNHIDYNLRLINSPINQSTLFQETIDDYYYGNILRQLFFLTEKGQFLKENFKELPYYEFLEIKVNNLERAKFLDTDFYNNATIGQSIKEQLKMLWNYYSVSNASTIHADHNFIANFEVFVLTLLVSDDTFAQTNSNGNSYSFQDVLNQSEFEDKLEVFLKKRLDNIDASLYQSLESSVGVSLNNSKQLIEKINSDKISFNRINCMRFNHFKIKSTRY